jgi:hypothetical protein
MATDYTVEGNGPVTKVGVRMTHGVGGEAMFNADLIFPAGVP